MNSRKFPFPLLCPLTMLALNSCYPLMEPARDRAEQCRLNYAIALSHYSECTAKVGTARDNGDIVQQSDCDGFLLSVLVGYKNCDSQE
ncbi:MAG: hypothetical protein KDK33_05985 [Leptospiraceae bacterium]|nr:hypothetical protein [Leptospiraceae bacterium]